VNASPIFKTAGTCDPETAMLVTQATVMVEPAPAEARTGLGPQDEVPDAVAVNVTEPAPVALNVQIYNVEPPGRIVSGVVGHDTGETPDPPGPTKMVAVTPVAAPNPVLVTVRVTVNTSPPVTNTEVDIAAARTAGWRMDTVGCSVTCVTASPRTVAEAVFTTTDPVGRVPETATWYRRYPDRPTPTRAMAHPRVSGGPVAGGSPAVHGPAAVAPYTELVSAGDPDRSGWVQTTRLGLTYDEPLGRVSSNVRPMAVLDPALLQDTVYVRIPPPHNGPIGVTALWITIAGGPITAWKVVDCPHPFTPLASNG
jgi:hypothetical protein